MIDKNIKVEVIKWYDEKNDEILYGVDIFIDGKWNHVKFGEDRSCNFFKTRSKANEAKDLVIKSFEPKKVI